MGAKKLNVDVKRCLVVEDAPSGARSGLAAGAKVLAVGTGHDIAAVRAVSSLEISSPLSWRSKSREGLT